MTNLTPIRFAITQLGSLVNYIDKSLKDGFVEENELECMVVANDALKSCVLLLKGLKLKIANEKYLTRLEKLVSNADYYKAYNIIDKLEPSHGISKDRISQVAGQRGIYDRVNIAVARDNINDIYENLRNKLDERGEIKDGEDITDFTLDSISTAYEVANLLIEQFADDLKNRK